MLIHLITRMENPAINQSLDADHQFGATKKLVKHVRPSEHRQVMLHSSNPRFIRSFSVPWQIPQTFNPRSFRCLVRFPGTRSSLSMSDRWTLTCYPKNQEVFFGVIREKRCVCRTATFVLALGIYQPAVPVLGDKKLGRNHGVRVATFYAAR